MTTTNSKSLDNLVEDIYHLFDPEVPHEVSEENLEWFCDTLKDVLRVRFREREHDNNLRFSMLGQPDRKIWYRSRATEQEKMLPKTYFKFLYGDVIEALVLFLAKEAGHKVEDLQREVEVDGVKGHIDAIIDDVVVDVKSASPFGYKKFFDHKVLDDDLFGYGQQLSGYSQVLRPGKAAAWIAFNKVDGDLCVSPMKVEDVNRKEYNVQDRIKRIREVVELDTPPDRCYPDEPDGKSGNRKLGVGCSYCHFKHECWPGLRTFLYSTGPRYLTEVVRVPDVFELTDAEVSQ